MLLLLDRGFSLETASLIDGVFRLTVILAEVPMGKLSDKIGRRTSLHLVIAMTIATFLLIAAVNSVSVLIIAWVMWGIMWALSSGFLTAYAWEVGCFQENSVKSPVEFVQIRRVAAAVAILFSLVSAGPLYEASPSFPFLLTALCALMAWPFMLLLPREVRVEAKVHRETSVRSLLAEKRMFVAILLAAIVLSVGWSIQIAFQPVGLEMGLDPRGISFLFAGFAISQIIGAWLAGFGGFTYQLMVSISLIGSSFAIFCVWSGGSVVDNDVLVFIALLTLGGFYSYGTTVSEIWISRLSQSENRATMLSVVSMFGGCVMLFARPLLGVSTGSIGAFNTFGLWGLVSLPTIVLGIVLAVKTGGGEGRSVDSKGQCTTD